ncbi:MAG: hypothetical protein IT450_20360 [Phycisphaerales bacterium]|nr:hypothetical protein [Phycisphaerales bacterium]
MKVGRCHLCLTQAPLTFEHIPPRRCFNDSRCRAWTLQRLADDLEAKTTKYARGVGRNSLCEACNRLTAELYGYPFARFVEQGMRLADRAATDPLVYVAFQIQPLAVIKQVCVMMIAASDFGRSLQLDNLRRFCLQPRRTGLPPRYKLYVYFNPSEHIRFLTHAAIGNVAHRVPMILMAEITRRPFGFVGILNESDEHDVAQKQGLASISHFAQYDHRSFSTVSLRIPRRIPVSKTPVAFER